MYRNSLKFADLENYINTEVRPLFHDQGFIEAFDFFCIVIWKANRAKSKIARRFDDKPTADTREDLDGKIKYLTQLIFKSVSDKERLEILIKNYGFRLPIASAILSFLYPDNFTIYDYRVCEVFPDFIPLGNLSDIDKIWPRYLEFIEAVKSIEEQEYTLQEKDRMLWGYSFKESLKKDIEICFSKK
ncbi:MAG: hypothetical protein M9948_14255 [Lentimicrobium sp.]|nr:hypothetical protein [Lentimicrobium sp.]